MATMKCRVYSVDGVQNVRDLGGYEAADGRVTQYGRFIRTASLSGLTDAGRKVLMDLRLRMVVDLRSTFEVAQKPDAPFDGTVVCAHIPMFDQINSKVAEGDTSAFPASMAEMYVDLLKTSPDRFRTMFETFATAKGCALFHCTAGKDRTGLTAMLLLGLAGVDEETIIEDYTYTERLLTFDDKPPEMPDYLFGAKDYTMRTAIDFLKNNYGGIVPYLKHAGLEEPVLQAVKARLLDETAV